MKAILFIAHPDESSFCHALADRAERRLYTAGIAVNRYDLYRMHFDPVLAKEDFFRKDCFDEQVSSITSDLQNSDYLLFVHPDWWGQPPAIMKGLIDRVFRQGVAYDFEGDEFEPKHHVGLLNMKRALVLCTTDTSDTEHINLIQSVWRDGILKFCGITSAQIIVYDNIRNSRYADRCCWLDQVETCVSNAFL